MHVLYVYIVAMSICKKSGRVQGVQCDVTLIYFHRALFSGAEKNFMGGAQQLDPQAVCTTTIAHVSMFHECACLLDLTLMFYTYSIMIAF